MASENGHHRGLLVDYGGVLTTNLFDSFRSFCELEGLEPESNSSLDIGVEAALAMQPPPPPDLKT